MTKKQNAARETEKPPYGLTKQQWRRIQRAALKIDPRNALVTWGSGWHDDPYHAYRNIPETYKVYMKYVYARSPWNDVWVEFWDLPKKTRDALYKRIAKQNARQKCVEKKPYVL